jgi:hypothetical protein
MDYVIFVPKTVKPFGELFNRVNYLVLGLWNLYLAGCALLFVFCLL